MGIKIREWETHGMNGRFQYCVPQDPLVYHNDAQTWAAMVYLTPDAPPECGTSLYVSKDCLRTSSEPNFESPYAI